jgi:hypothetical protein
MAVALLNKKRESAIQEEIRNEAKTGKILSKEEAATKAGVIKIDNEILAEKNKTIAKEQTAVDANLKAQQAQFQQYFNKFSGQFNTALNGWIQGQTTMKQAAEKMFGDVLTGLTGFAEQWLEKKAEMWLEDQLLTKVITIGNATSQITAAAGVAGANAVAATSGIPLIGPAAAPAAGAAAAGEALGFESFLTGSAAGGGIMPQDMFLLAHKNEMMLPAPIAQHVVNSMGGNDNSTGGDTHVHFHVSAMDGNSVASFFQNNQTHIANSVIASAKKGKIGLKHFPS